MWVCWRGKKRKMKRKRNIKEAKGGEFKKSDILQRKWFNLLSNTNFLECCFGFFGKRSEEASERNQFFFFLHFCLLKFPFSANCHVFVTWCLPTHGCFSGLFLFQFSLFCRLFFFLVYSQLDLSFGRSTEQQHAFSPFSLHTGPQAATAKDA